MNLLLGMKLLGAFNSAKSKFKRECQEAGVQASDPLKDPVSALITVAIAMGVVDTEQATSIASQFGSRHNATTTAKIKNDAIALQGAADFARDKSWKAAYDECGPFEGPGTLVHFGVILERELQNVGVDWRELHWSQVFGGGD